MKNRALILQNASGEGPGIISHFLDCRGWDYETIFLFRGEGISSTWNTYDLLMVFGGPMNVYEEDSYPYLAQETRIIRQALSKGMPLLGFCLGAQLMAKASGARVFKGHKKEIGWYRAKLTNEGEMDPFLKTFPKEFPVFQWHGDTFDLPEKSVRLAYSDNYMNQAMRIGSLGYGFQFHFEITSQMIKEWLENGREEIEDSDDKIIPEQIHNESKSCLPLIHSLAQSFFDHYLSIIEARKIGH